MARYGVNCGVVGGFKKIWAFFPAGDFQGLSRSTGKGTPS